MKPSEEYYKRKLERAKWWKENWYNFILIPALVGAVTFLIFASFKVLSLISLEVNKKEIQKMIDNSIESNNITQDRITISSINKTTNFICTNTIKFYVHP